MISLGNREGRTIMEGKFEGIIVTTDVWRKRNMRAVNMGDHLSY